ncbi:hypothetical protein [Nitrosospira sp. NpAV]|uniref:hypothetical protein n=1 Tax=Nitrosospira sp. NpAV TaxID=58133 RepID=UPI000B18EEB9|nr:hypothetical protein [Nitrosospira sp. NpAV]
MLDYLITAPGHDLEIGLEHLRYVRYRTERFRGKRDNLKRYVNIRNGTGFSET